MMTPKEPTKTITIIGGGVSGALTAFHLIQQKTPSQVIVFDKRPYFGLGLAYSRADLARPSADCSRRNSQHTSRCSRITSSTGCGRTTIRVGDYTINLDRRPPQLDDGLTA